MDIMPAAGEGGGITPVATLLWLIDAGGVVVVILFAMSLVAATIVLLKLWQFHACGIGDLRKPRRAAALYAAGDSRAARNLVVNSANPVSQLLRRAMEGRSEGREPPERLRERLARDGADHLEVLRSYFRPLEVIATLSPLLGLFGTVLGMIEAFRQLEHAGAQVNPALLSGGIWQALLTTAVGLGVAIPTVALLSWLERRVDRVAHEMEATVGHVLTASAANGSGGTDDAESTAGRAPVAG